MAKFMELAIKRLHEMPDDEFIALATGFGLLDDGVSGDELHLNDILSVSFCDADSMVGEWEYVDPALSCWDNIAECYAANDEMYALAA